MVIEAQRGVRPAARARQWTDRPQTGGRAGARSAGATRATASARREEKEEDAAFTSITISLLSHPLSPPFHFTSSSSKTKLRLLFLLNFRFKVLRGPALVQPRWRADSVRAREAAQSAAGVVSPSPSPSLALSLSPAFVSSCPVLSSPPPRRGSERAPAAFSVPGLPL